MIRSDITTRQVIAAKSLYEFPAFPDESQIIVEEEEEEEEEEDDDLHVPQSCFKSNVW